MGEGERKTESERERERERERELCCCACMWDTCAFACIRRYMHAWWREIEA
jgi:hypothetical protein